MALEQQIKQTRTLFRYIEPDIERCINLISIYVPNQEEAEKRDSAPIQAQTYLDAISRMD